MSDSSSPTSTIVATASDTPSSTVSPFLVVFDIIVAIFGFLFSFNWSLLFSRLFHVVAFPFRLILFPLSFIVNILITLLAPAIYLVLYAWAGVRAVIDFFVALEPLYTFFGAAAGVGIFAGIALAMSSSLITSYLGMQDDDAASERPTSKQSLSLDTGSQRDSSGTDIDWQWLDSPTHHRRRPARGLLSQTIHEEDDDSEY
ncbi:hypothetical protein FZEAL_4969 [Fusarium zealandicum]|uniref:Uncharacterized protein n=1 Tax=Fusarium zealandicum TaxID=1053134 RepID=A0A8H4ULG7_9HYPO|nr:hypothetical protein FZEAL_4969 [Fusarium zealandicum]